MNCKVFILGCILISVLFLSNSTGVPQAVAGAPGEANNLSCKNCHTPSGNFNPTISVEVMNPDSSLVNAYVPGQNYIVRVKIKGENNPKSFGFQMVSLANDNNADMGIWSGLGDKVKQITALNRKYLVQSSSKASGVFTSNWKAPSTDKGKIVFYAAGLAINQNGNTSGDNNVTGKLTINSPSTSSSFDTELNTIYAYPNPMENVLNIQGGLVKTIQLYDATGKIVVDCPNDCKSIDTNHLPNGVYFVRFLDVQKSILKVQKVIKI